uniref:Pyrin domain-containing protein n=1 Tax=Pundamilia nyererei TaxID=303518 RepID=A0A3B4ET47_9CICH
MTSEDLLNTLEDLGDEEFNKFKWFLQQEEILEEFPTIKKSRLQATSTWDTVDLMVQTYRLPGAVEVTRKVLERIHRNDLLESFSAISGAEGQLQITCPKMYFVTYFVTLLNESNVF